VSLLLLDLGISFTDVHVINLVRYDEPIARANAS
jgi:hypothetical protein